MVRAWAVTVTAVLLLASAVGLDVWLSSRQASVPASFHLSGTDLVVSDQDGRPLWRRGLPDRPDPGAYPVEEHRNKVWFGRLGREQTTSVLFAFQPVSDANREHLLHCFSRKGDTRWVFRPGRKVVDGEQEYPTLYHIRGFRVLPSPARDGRSWIVLSAPHASHQPCQVAVLDQDGRILYEYWHSGALDIVEIEDLDRDGFPEILLAGVDHPRRQAALVVLDTRRMAGAPPVQPSDTVSLASPQPEFAEAVVLFPRSALNQKLEPHNSVQALTLVDPSIVVQVEEQNRSPEPYLLYTLDRNLRPLAVEASVALRDRYRDLKATGLLNQEFTEAQLEGLRREVQVLRY